MAAFYTNAQIRGNNILLRGYDQDGLAFKREVKYQPFLFVSSKVDEGYRTIHDKNVSRLDFESIREAKNFAYQNKDVSNADVYGLTNFIYPFLYERYTGKIDFDKKKIKVCTIDIENANSLDIERAPAEITAITMGFRGFKIALGCGNYTPTSTNIKYYKFTDEDALLRGFIEIWKNIMPDVITGWNIEFFDVPYLITRIINILGEEEVKKLSPWNLIDTSEITIRGRKHTVRYPVGIAILDYQQLYVKFNEKKKESYKLDFIAKDENLKVKKLDYKAKYKTLEEMRNKDFQLYMEYNVQDVEVVEQLDAKKGFLSLVFTIAYWAKINYEDVFSPVKTWDVIIHNHLMDKNIVVSPHKDPIVRDLVGAHVKEPIPGLYHWCISLDLDSLYPHLMMMYNISPDTFVGVLKQNMTIDNILNGSLTSIRDTLIENNVTIAPNLTLYTKEKQGFIPFLVHDMYNHRKKVKESMIELKKKQDKNLDYQIDTMHNEQYALKILLNSLYGALANEYFRWYDINQAEAITSGGQISILWIEKAINQYFNKILKTDNEDYVIAIDTDSVVGDTRIYVNNHQIEIETFYNQYCNANNLEIQRNTYDFIHNVTNDNLYTKSYDGSKISSDKIIRCMKHTVKKRMFKLTVNEKCVTVTEDHSLIVERNGKLISVKPQDVLENDIFINISNDTIPCQQEVYNIEKTKKRIYIQGKNKSLGI